MEIWKPIKHYENLYEVSNLGRIKSLARIVDNRYQTEEKIKKPYYNKVTGYYSISLWKNGEQRTWAVHKLVAQAFITNPNQLPQVNHKNGRKLDNRANNLEWVTSKENNDHAIKTCLRKPRKHKILCVELNLEFINAYKASEYILNKNITTAKLATVYHNILAVAKNNKGTAYKYHWKFI